jgi:hypothetical protein
MGPPIQVGLQHQDPLDPIVNRWITRSAGGVIQPFGIVPLKLRTAVKTEAASMPEIISMRDGGLFQFPLLGAKTPDYVKTNKNDAADASMRFVGIKGVEQQTVLATHRIRSLLVAERTALVNQT